MKKILAVILTLVVVFCTFAGCGDTVKDDNSGSNTTVTDNSGDNDNTDNTGDTDKTDDTGNDENDGDDNGNGNGNTDKVVSPIINGGSFDGGNYS